MSKSSPPSSLNEDSSRGKLDSIPFFLSFTALFAFIVITVFYPQDVTKAMNVMGSAITGNLGWLCVLFSFLMIVFVAVIIMSPIGDIRIGGKDAKPSFGIVRWFSISLCAGIGIGILFWGIGEPIYHFMKPPQQLGITPASHEASLFAVSQSILHWSIAQYCIYAVCGVIFALMAFNEHKPLTIMSGLDPLLPKNPGPAWRNSIHTICLFSICCAVVSSLGSLVMMTSSCIAHVTGIPRGFALDAAVTLFSTVFFVASSTTGLKRGMSFLSVQNTRLFFFLLFFIFAFGPTVYILNMGTESLGYLLNNFFRHSTIVSAKFLPDGWADAWIVIYMAWFFAYGPPIGLYLARLGRGRTVRQFLLMNVFAPTVFVYLWINTFGSLAIHLQLAKLVDVWKHVQTQGIEATVIGILQQFPCATALIIVFLIVTMISFVTLVDPMTSVLATISTRGISAEDEAPGRLKIVWGGNMGAVALALITIGGVAALRGTIALGGLLLMLLTVAFCWSIVKVGVKILREQEK